MPTRWLFPLVVLTLAPRPAHAEAVDLPPTRIETARADETELGTGTATVVPTEGKTGGGLDLADLLETQPGIHLRHFGGPGEFTAVSLRGLGPDNVAVILDDLPLANTTLGPVDLSLVPLESIERVELYRGVGPVRFPAPLGGVLRLVTRAPTDHQSIAAHLGTGSFSTHSAHLFAAGPVADLRYTAMVHGSASAGDFPYVDDRATLYNREDDRRRRRRNNAHQDLLLRLGAETDLGDGALLRLTSQGLWADRGVPGPGNITTQRASAHNSESLARLSLTEVSLADGRARLAVGVDALIGARQFRDPLRETGLHTTGADTRLTQLGADGRAEVLWNLTHETELAPRVVWQQFRQRGSGAAAAVGALRHKAQRLETAIGLEHRSELGGGLRLVPAIRADWVADQGSGAAGQDDHQFSPRLGLLWPVRWCELRANAGRFHRFPTLLERYGDGGATFVANLDLEPEQGLLADGGVTCRGRWPGTRRVTAHLGGFYTRANELIVMTQASALRVVADNVGRNDILGLEASAGAESTWASGTLSYTLISAEDASDTLLAGSQTPGIPRHAVDAELGVGPEWLRLTYQLSLTSQTYLDRANLLPLPARLVHHLEARARHQRSGFELALTVRNLGDRLATAIALPGGRTGRAKVSDFIGYPIPGRSFFAALIWRTP